MEVDSADSADGSKVVVVEATVPAEEGAAEEQGETAPGKGSLKRPANAAKTPKSAKKHKAHHGNTPAASGRTPKSAKKAA